MRGPAPSSFQYALLRVVPRVERGEFVNAGVVVFARTERFLAARVGLDADRVRALDPDADVAAIERHLDSLRRIASGDTEAGPIARLDQSERFNWLAAPSSTVVQASPVHTGVCDDPQKLLDSLYERLVA
jgi:Protein of unknown function (DUF3037)